jgi:hypothetical protein
MSETRVKKTTKAAPGVVGRCEWCHEDEMRLTLWKDTDDGVIRKVCANCRAILSMLGADE